MSRTYPQSGHFGMGKVLKKKKEAKKKKLKGGGPLEL